ncbi:N-acetyl sugar amidotransferase [Pelomonas sp. P7]|uniref:N-acetyl sugar amidotransferase n=1 Tax=Pelomonas caseinilytica TaxID=2906763 RepID=A0ABS8XB58_9BURK|nr:N-acetyl sugar amidotransferase [Pelomonas sp. P7]MCE4538164.1 N-acetyl sugar amidotransferase [Pelomonas sp. P7]
MKQICTRCLMDSTIPDISFDAQGVCNYCTDLVALMGKSFSPDAAQRKAALSAFVEQVKRDGQGKEYDCIIGLSGGVDSAWVLYQAKKLGLRPLSVHMDNGWNSNLAQSNIEGLVRTLDVHLFTHVIDWHEYRELMQAFFDADVVDVELLYDNAMFAVNYRLAAKYGIKWILAGTNKSTEGMRMPPGWNWFKFDARNIRCIGKRRGVTRLKTFPAIGVLEYVWQEYIRKVRWVSFLDLLDYKKEEALQVLERECGYRRYPYKHYESIFTRFYQGFILPRKFRIDKRKVHLATLVTTGQMTRADALQKLSEIPYPSQAELDSDRLYFLKKMNWSEQQLDAYIARPEKGHAEYGTELGLWKLLANIYKLAFGRPKA